MSERARRWLTAGSGIASAALYGAVAVAMNDAPGAELDAASVHAWVEDHRTLILVSGYLWGLCSCATWGFLTGLWDWLADRGDRALATLGLVAGVAIYVVALAGFSALVLAAYRVDVHTAETTRQLNDLALISVCLTGFPTVASMLGYLAVMFRRRLFPAWTRWLGVVLTVAHLVSGGAFAASGMLSPSGIGVYVAPVLYYAWIVALSVHLLRSRDG